MKNYMTTLLLLLATQVCAQEMLLLNGKKYRIADIENITVTTTRPQLPDVLAAQGGYSIFSEALEVTGIADSISYWDTFGTYSCSNNTGRPGSSFRGPYYVPTDCKIKYSVFAVTDETFASLGITNLSDLKVMCVEWYGRAADWYDYPGKGAHAISTGNDYTSVYNVLNMFVRYHIIKAGAPVSRLLYEYDPENWNWNFAFGGEPYEYYETLLPHTLMKIWQPLYQNTGESTNIWINRWRANNTLTDEVGTFGSDATHSIIKTGSLIVRDQSDITALNGYIHTVNAPLIYNTDVVNGVLNERMRVDAGAILHELSNNGIRFATTEEIGTMNQEGTDGTLTRLPLDYFENFVCYSGEKTHFAWYTTGPWRAWGADQVSIWGSDNKGVIDFAFRLPSVPSGTYEVRFIYPPMSNCGMVYPYIGTSSDTTSMQLLVPFDAAYPNSGSQEDRRSSGYLLVSEFQDYGVESDQILHSNGYLRAPASFSRGTYNQIKNRIASPYELTATISNCCRYEEGYGTTMLRRILGTVEISQQNDYWLRLKIVNPTGSGISYDQFGFSFDFIELVPTSVVNNSNFSEDWY